MSSSSSRRAFRINAYITLNQITDIIFCDERSEPWGRRQHNSAARGEHDAPAWRTSRKWLSDQTLAAEGFDHARYFDRVDRRRPNCRALTVPSRCARRIFAKPAPNAGRI